MVESRADSRSKKIACTECRQQKAKCDAFKMAAGEPCTRCRKRSIPCKLIQDFKRTYKRARLPPLGMSYEQQDLAFLPPPPMVPFSRSNTPPNGVTVANSLFLTGRPTSIPPANTPPLPVLPRNESFYNSNHVAMNNLISAATSPNIPSKVAATQMPLANPEPKNNQLEPSVVKFSEFQMYPPEPIPKPVVTEAMLACQAKSLGEVFLPAEQVAALFKIFLRFYHPFFPVVNVDIGIDRIYRLSPVLFWTMMFIALRRHHSYDDCITKEIQQDLYFKVSATLKSVLAEITISPITRYDPMETEDPILNVSSVYTVQAFLLYTFWPPLISSLSADSSWNTISIAYYQAIRMGLHSSLRSKDGLDRTEQIKTWIACNVVSQTIATAFGFPAFVQSHGSLLTICKNEDFKIPFQLTQMLEIQLFEDQIARTLNNNIFDSSLLADASEKLPLIQLLSNELDHLEMRLCSDDKKHMDDFRKCTLLASRVHLFSYHFLDTSRIAKFELRKGIVKVYNASVAFLNHIQDSNLRDKYFVANLPSVYNLIIWQVSVIIARLIHSPYRDILDIGAGKSQYMIAMKMTHKASIIKHDIAYRSAGIMKQTWLLFKKLDEIGEEWPKVTVTSRMSVSVFFDSLMILREKCGMRKLSNKNNSASGEEDVDDVDDDVNVEDVDDIGVKRRKMEDATAGGSVSNTNAGEPSVPETPSASNAGGHAGANYESAARKIMSTIPLDPQPIPISVSPSNGSSPNSTTTKSPNNSGPGQVQDLKRIVNGNSPNVKIGKSPLSIHKPVGGVTLSNNSTPMHPDSVASSNNASGPLGGSSWENWDAPMDFDTELLFKDLDTVMNDFGFHGEF